MKTQLKWLALAFPVALVAAEPVYHVAMDGSLDAFGADEETVHVCPSSVRARIAAVAAL